MDSRKIAEAFGPLSLEIELESDQSTIRRHIDHIKSRQKAITPEHTETSASQQLDDWTYLPDLALSTNHHDEVSPDPEPQPPTLCRSSRATHPPDRFGYSYLSRRGV